jgi:methylated-DNA-[protein]-cysteine S-methyltransferase
MKRKGTQMSTQTGARRSYTVIDSPIGPLTLVASDGRLVGLYMDTPDRVPAATVLGELVPADGGDPVLAAAAGQLKAYFAGQLTEFSVPLALAGTTFQRQVWTALQAIGYGQTMSYGQLADKLGQPSASRAVGLANGRNPVAIIVPCHRVIGADGSLTGYGGGLDRKRFLLGLEQRVSGQTLA